MKSNELFVGAWVSCYGDIGIVGMFNEETCAIWKNGDMSKPENYIETAGMSPLFPGDLNPIPLTLDILTRNGFKYNRATDRYMYGNTSFGLFEEEGYFIGVVCGVWRRVQYVHELQLLLNFSGITTNIKL